MSQKKSTIRRASRDRENPYVQILKAALRDRRLSWKARGILAYILTNKDTWKIYLSELEKHSDKDGRDGTASGFKELIEWGYVTRTRIHGEGGKFQGYDYEVTEYGKAVNGLAVNGSAVNGKPVTNNKEVVRDKEKKGGEAAEAAEATPEVLGKQLIYQADHMEQPLAKAIGWYMSETNNSDYDLAYEIVTLAIEFKKQIGAVKGNITIAHWAIWEAKEFHRYWTERNWGRGKTKRTQQKNQMKDVVATIRNRVNDQLTRGKYTRPAPGSPDYGKKPWEINQDKPVVRVATVAPTVEEEIEY